MRRSKAARKAVLCAVVAAAMFVGVAIPGVYAASYNVNSVNIGDTVFPGDTLNNPQGSTASISIRYLYEGTVIDGSGNNVSVEPGGSYTVPELNQMDLNYTIPAGKVFDGWQVVTKPDTTGGQLDLQLCLKGEQNVINTVGSWKLEEGVTYYLQDGITHVVGDSTTYANPITFTVSQTQSYTFK